MPEINLTPEEAEMIFNDLKIKYEADFNRIMNMISSDIRNNGCVSYETILAQKAFERKVLAEKDNYEKDYSK